VNSTLKTARTTRKTRLGFSWISRSAGTCWLHSLHSWCGRTR